MSRESGQAGSDSDPRAPKPGRPAGRRDRRPPDRYDLDTSGPDPRDPKQTPPEAPPQGAVDPAVQRARARLLIRLIAAAGTVAVVAIVFALAGARGRAIDRLIEELRSPEAAVRRRAAQVLAEEQRIDVRLHAPLLAALDDSDPEVRRWSARGLGTQGNPSDVPALERRIQDEKTPVRRAAAFSLLRIDPENAPSRKELTGAIQSGDGGVILALTSWDPAPTWATPTLIALLKDRRPGIRRLAADALGHTGRGSPDAAKALANASKDPDDRVRESVGRALGQLQK